MGKIPYSIVNNILDWQLIQPIWRLIFKRMLLKVKNNIILIGYMQKRTIIISIIEEEWRREEIFFSSGTYKMLLNLWHDKTNDEWSSLFVTKVSLLGHILTCHWWRLWPNRKLSLFILYRQNFEQFENWFSICCHGNEVGQDIQKHSSVSFIQVNSEAWIWIGNYQNMVDILQPEQKKVLRASNI